MARRPMKYWDLGFFKRFTISNTEISTNGKAFPNTNISTYRNIILEVDISEKLDSFLRRTVKRKYIKTILDDVDIYKVTKAKK